MPLAQTARQRGVQRVRTPHRLDAYQLDARYARDESRHLLDGEATPPGPTPGSQGEFHTRAMSCSFVLRDHMAGSSRHHARGRPVQVSSSPQTGREKPHQRFTSSNRDASLPLDPFASRVFEQPGRRGSSEEAVQSVASIQLLVVPKHALKIEPAID
jgi:hypothetical protein